MHSDPDLATLNLRIDELASGHARLSAELEDLASALLPDDFTMPGDDQSAAAPDATAPSAFSTLDDWVEHYFLPTFRRPVGGDIRWCRHWTEHPEAVTRLEALWRSWEALRLDPNLGIATWLTNYLDPLLPILLSRVGPFTQCSGDRHLSSQP